jgi:hypothetical protein
MFYDRKGFFFLTDFDGKLTLWNQFIFILMIYIEYCVNIIKIQASKNDKIPKITRKIPSGF